MKKLLPLILLIAALTLLTACGGGDAEQAATMTIQEWLDAEGSDQPYTMTVTIKEIENPVWAVVEDESGASVHLYGVMIDGEVKTFEEAGLGEGDVIVIADGKYNVYEGTVEIAEARLVEQK